MRLELGIKAVVGHLTAGPHTQPFRGFGCDSVSLEVDAKLLCRGSSDCTPQLSKSVLRKGTVTVSILKLTSRGGLGFSTSDKQSETGDLGPRGIIGSE